MAVLICKNISTEGPGTIEDFLKRNGISYSIVDLSKGEAIPSSEGFKTLVMLGGPMSVNERDKYPYLNDEEAVTRTFAAEGKGVLGICLGAQIIANAFGAKVYKGTEREMGWRDIELTEDGLRDPLMRKLAVHPVAGDIWKRFKVFHWHGETFDIPEGAVRLSKSDLYPNQAFRYGTNCYAFQFHIEVTREMIFEWLACEEIDLEKVKNDTERLYAIYSARAERFYETYFQKNSKSETPNPNI